MVNISEARRGRPRKNPLPAGAEAPTPANVQFQLRKSISLRGQYSVEFADGSKLKVDPRTAQEVLNRIDDTRLPAQKQELVKKLSASAADFKKLTEETISESHEYDVYHKSGDRNSDIVGSVQTSIKGYRACPAYIHQGEETIHKSPEQAEAHLRKKYNPKHMKEGFVSEKFDVGTKVKLDSRESYQGLTPGKTYKVTGHEERHTVFGNYVTHILDGKHKIVNGHMLLKKVNEETISELSKGTLGNYIRKATEKVARNEYDAGGLDAETNHMSRYHNATKYKKLKGKSLKRQIGISQAVRKLTREETIAEGADYHCPHCGDRLGKESEVRHGQSARGPYCGNCGNYEKKGKAESTSDIKKHITGMKRSDAHAHLVKHGYEWNNGGSNGRGTEYSMYKSRKTGQMLHVKHPHDKVSEVKDLKESINEATNHDRTWGKEPSYHYRDFGPRRSKKTGSIKDHKMIGQRVRHYEHGEGTVKHVYREHTFSSLVPYHKVATVSFDNGTEHTVSASGLHHVKPKKVSEALLSTDYTVKKVKLPDGRVVWRKVRKNVQVQ